MSSIYHIVSETAYEEAKVIGYYEPASIGEEGFIHCSYADQVCRIADHHFDGKAGLLLLEIDRTLTDCEVIDEDLYELNELFPHIYGKLPNRAVIAAHKLEQGSDGLFRLPDKVKA